MSQWFRLYESVLDDPKVQKLPPKTFKAWVNILCLACRHDGTIPDLADIAFALRVGEVEASNYFADLCSAGLIERGEGDDWFPHNWASRQYKSDGSAERMRRHRERHRNVTVTPSESEADTEQIQSRTEGESAVAPRPPKSTKSGTRIPSDWRPSDAGRAYAAERGLDPDSTADAFIDWWSAANGPNAIKRDWDAAFRTWCRRDATRPLVQATNRPVQSTTGHGAYLEQLAAIASRDDADEFDRG